MTAVIYDYHQLMVPLALSSWLVNSNFPAISGCDTWSVSSNFGFAFSISCNFFLIADTMY